MRKRILFTILIVILMSISLVACGGGNIDSMKKTIDESEIYSNEEIESAMGVVTHLFQEKFKGCTLTELSYDESISSASSDAWAIQYQAEEAIVLVSSFHVDDTGGDGSLNPNSTYNNWQ
jgi:hypothetical protein